MGVIGHGVEIVPSELQRPASPPDGSLIYQSDINQLLVWNGSVWGPLGAGSITTDATAPSSPSSGDLWYDTDSGKTFVWYDDGSSAQWVEIGASSTLPDHAANHARGGADVIDGDRLNIDYVPTYYTRDDAASGAGDVTDLTAHLAGIENNFEKVRVDSSGRVTLPYQPSFLATCSTNISHATVSQNNPVIFNTTSYNIGNNYNTSNGRFTAPVTGTYLFNAGIYCSAGIQQLWFIIDGSRERSFVVDSTSNANVAGMGIVRLNAGQWIGITPWCGGSTVTIYSNFYHTYFRGALLC